MRSIVALACGLLFGLGLGVSQMVDPAKVIGFLDVAGAWDPTLLFVMGGALLITLPVFLPTIGRGRPMMAESFSVPAKTEIDGRLLGGAAIFGLGWGLVGFCPGPAIASLAYLRQESVIFLAAMAAGMLLFRLLPGPSAGRSGEVAADA